MASQGSGSPKGGSYKGRGGGGGISKNSCLCPLLHSTHAAHFFPVPIIAFYAII